jgi:hypothetical protein
MFFQAVYYHVRSLDVKVPFMTAKDALLQLFERVRVLLWLRPPNRHLPCTRASNSIASFVVPVNRQRRKETGSPNAMIEKRVAQFRGCSNRKQEVIYCRSGVLA